MKMRKKSQTKKSATTARSVARGKTDASKYLAPPPGEPPMGSVARWFADNPAALASLDGWLTLKAAGRAHPRWGLLQVLRDLREKYGMPLSDSGVRGWLQRHRPKLYAQVQRP
jgi:hypothetical protein